jgi:hypothetical protein
MLGSDKPHGMARILTRLFRLSGMHLGSYILDKINILIKGGSFGFRGVSKGGQRGNCPSNFWQKLVPNSYV